MVLTFFQNISKIQIEILGITNETKHITIIHIQEHVSVSLITIIYIQEHVSVSLITIIYTQEHVSVSLITIIYTQEHVSVSLITIIYIQEHVSVSTLNSFNTKFLHNITGKTFGDQTHCFIQNTSNSRNR